MSPSTTTDLPGDGRGNFFRWIDGSDFSNARQLEILYIYRILAKAPFKPSSVRTLTDSKNNYFVPAAVFAVFTIQIAISSGDVNVKYVAENKCILDQNTGTYCSACCYFAQLHVNRLSQG